MTDPYRPHIRTQADVEEAWRQLIRPLGFHRRSLWLLLIDRDDRPTPVMTEITDLPRLPDSESIDGLRQLLEHFVTDDEPSCRWALLLSRPGAHAADEADRSWAGALYGMLRAGSIPHEAIHLATDTQIRAIPLDDVTGYVRAS